MKIIKKGSKTFLKNDLDEITHQFIHVKIPTKDEDICKEHCCFYDKDGLCRLNIACPIIGWNVYGYFQHYKTPKKIDKRSNLEKKIATLLLG